MQQSCATTVIEHYRFGLDCFEGKSFNSICTLIYFDNMVFVTGLCGKFNRVCWRELELYLFSKPHIDNILYERRKRKHKVMSIKRGNNISIVK